MKNYKFILLKLFLITVCLWSASASGMRDYVCIVNANYSEENKAFLNNYKNTMVSSGYSDFGKYIDDYLKGSFGSGFVYTASNGKSYIITNRHVISSGKTATVKFEKDDGTYDEYKDLVILGVDEDLDLAVIELPSSFKRSGLSFSTAKVEDGQDVYTAGFPGLGDEPVWQLGKGIVSNSSARIKELIDPEISVLIQHSAQVDGGNSGGPLLIQSSKSRGGYAVIGINTWKAIKRENTNFAVPATVVKKSVDTIIASKGKNNKISDRLTKFNASIANEEETFYNFSRYISNEMVSKTKGKVFTNILNAASSSAYKIILSTFANDPIEGVKYALSYYIWTSFKKSGKTIEYTTGDPVSTERGYDVAFAISEKKSLSSSWINEQGIWRLVDFNGIISGENVEMEKTFSMTNPYVFKVYGGYSSLDVNGLEGSGFAFEGGIQFSTVEIFGGIKKGFPSDDGKGYMFGSKGFLPLNFGNFIIQPGFGFEGDFYDSYYFGHGFLLCLFAELDFTYCISDKIGIGVCGKYLKSFFGDDKASGFTVTAGLRFGFGGGGSTLW